MLHTPSSRYHALREELKRLQAADVPDMPAVERVLDALNAEYHRLKSEDGQHGNNPIEWRHGEPPVLVIRPEDVLPAPREDSEACGGIPACPPRHPDPATPSLPNGWLP